jgi:hypothetical protein
LEVMMKLATKTLGPALLLAAIPLFAGSASAAPLSQALALDKAETGTVEQVQYRRARRHYRSGYYAYGWAPGYGSRRRAWNYGNGSAATAPGSWGRCPSDRFQASGYPSWMCR